MNILGIETSCDETAAAVVRDGRDVLSNVVYSQVEQHGRYGGVVPEIASRSHVEKLPTVIRDAMTQAQLDWDDLDAVAFTRGPGLASSLLIGIATAKALAWRLGKPMGAMNHIEAHLYSVFLGPNAPRLEAVCPFVSLIVSGGHTCLVRVTAPGRYTLLGQTIDDAAGEAFDKGAKILRLGYPGGPVMDRLARQGDPRFVRFPRGRQKKATPNLGGMEASLCFSFSGLKTALLYYVNHHPLSDDGHEVPSLAASYQEAIVDALVQRCDRALQGEKTLAACGGVSLNSRLRQALRTLADRRGVRLLLAEPAFCADNAAMIAGLAGTGRGEWGEAAMAADATPGLPLIEESVFAPDSATVHA